MPSHTKTRFGQGGSLVFDISPRLASVVDVLGNLHGWMIGCIIVCFNWQWQWRLLDSATWPHLMYGPFRPKTQLGNESRALIAVDRARLLLEMGCCQNVSSGPSSMNFQTKSRSTYPDQSSALMSKLRLNTPTQTCLGLNQSLPKKLLCYPQSKAKGAPCQHNETLPSLSLANHY